MVIFYNLYGLLFFVVTRVQPPPSPAWDTPDGRALVQRPPPRASGRIRRRLPRRRHVRADERSACVLHAAHVGESDLRLFVPGHVCARRGARHAGDGHRDDRWRPSAGTRSRDHPVALRFRVPVVQRNHGSVPDRFAGVDGRDPARQEPRVPQVVRLSQPLQRADRSGRGAGLDVPTRRLRMERCDRMVDQHGGVRPLHRRLPHAAAQDDPTRGLRHRSATRSPGQACSCAVGFRGGGLDDEPCRHRLHAAATRREADESSCPGSRTCGCSFSSSRFYSPGTSRCTWSRAPRTSSSTCSPRRTWISASGSSTRSPCY